MKNEKCRLDKEFSRIYQCDLPLPCMRYKYVYVYSTNVRDSPSRVEIHRRPAKSNDGALQNCIAQHPEFRSVQPPCGRPTSNALRCARFAALATRLLFPHFNGRFDRPPFISGKRSFERGTRESARSIAVGLASALRRRARKKKKKESRACRSRGDQTLRRGSRRKNEERKYPVRRMYVCFEQS